MIIREALPCDSQRWSQLRTLLWPDTEDGHRAEIAAYFAGTSVDIVNVLVVEAEPTDGQIAGFIELNIRNFAEGSRQNRVPYVEGWYVDGQFRRRGYGAKLMAAAENWARQEGFAELASDTEPHNHHSIALHKKLGFAETERVVCFLKQLR